MATTARQPKSTRGRGGAPDANRRPSAWGQGGRASPAFSPASNPVRLPTSPQGGAFPPLTQPNGTRTPDAAGDRVLQALSGLTGTTITLMTKTAQRYEGTIASTNGEGDTTGVTLKDVKEVSSSGAPLKDRLFIASTNIDTWTSGPADSRPTNGANGDTFKTDTDISQKAAPRRERELQSWADSPLPSTALNNRPGLADDETFGSGSSTGLKWDQFTVNETLFGVKTDWNEDLYTTKLDRSRPDFKEREREAQRIANEIMGAATNNPHIAEERNLDLPDGAGANEEDKYGAVVRGANAYVPPGARKQGGVGAPAPVKTDVPKVSVNAPDGTAVQSAQSGATPPKTTSPVPTASVANKPPADPLPAFRQFVTTEKERLKEKRHALVKNELDKRRAELLKFSQSFKLNKPIPEDLVPILAKDEEKQQQIREKSARDAASAQARSIGTSTTSVMSPSPSTRIQQPSPAQTPKLTSVKTSAAAGGSSAKASILASSSTNVASASKASSAKADSAKRISMFIQPIPPFKGKKSTPNGQAPASTASSTGATTGGAVAPPSPNAPRLSVNAPSFKPNPKAVAFTPTTTSPNPSSSPASPKGKAVDTSASPNPFFGPRIIKKTPPVSMRDDFNPFKYNKVAEASAVNALWPYNGKPYKLMFPPITVPPQQQSPHIPPPPGPPQMPPQSYEEDPQPQAPRGFIYAYPPYAYPGQPMIPGMGPPPPGYMPGPHMQPMPYPYAMPPPNAMYASPQMGQMPPPQYMPPPPGPYPPNGNAGRPSMPPTPIPAHAHPYYHQSPQLQHAVPYPMMIQPGMPPHPYEAAPAAPAPPVGM
ncbi:hypothetical protein NEOLEDRAFT_1141136 [Neolentinus lepideus HHB14362 ss-1]|uniref:LsmAD domain-containing protein n=1 Tax=Neolentinus lepideus HHB14362 ss-1 TaxID=1314782 RepID=A0A165NVH6_9AGAM|nr:hypothetical protein NEOLEDRAFT_1141136 [Neolentinus lepideus HHB14362 ss-1]